MAYKKEDRENLIATVKTVGETLINDAESIVGENTDCLSNFSIWIHLDADSVPTYEVTQEYDIPPYSERQNK
ncbi:MAG: hypothetical protein LUE29_09620 [Lachnospiraceae bacterium]|nr:hypothetical protein [Lachnospiraceae bacterium]